MKNDRQKFGEESELQAVTYLKKQGYRILQQNYRNSLGEIDIIATDRKVIAFIEVKAKRSPFFGHPKYAVTLKKQRKISMVALVYLKQTHQMQKSARFDVVTVQRRHQNYEIELIKNAFELAYP
ncbi:MAG: YraN family protein [Deltaproteobacteria bacterium]|nr:YraN family protein [Deltaproteobacteria bacterium]